MTTAATIMASLVLDASDFESGIKTATKSAGSFETKMKDVGRSMQKVGAGLTLALTAPIVAFGTSSLNSAMEAESAMTELEAVIKSTGGVAGVTAKEVSDMASALQDVTKFSDETILNGQSMLLTFTNIGSDVFPQATEAMLNMAEKFGSVDQAAIQLGKALNDPIAGVAALRRVGIQLSAAQEKQIEDFMAVGDIASAQAVILGELETQFGNLARAAGQTTAGQFEQFKNKLDDMKEIIGTALIPVLIRFMEAVTPLIEQFSNATPETQNLIIAIAGILAVAGPVISTLGSLVTVVGTLTPMFASFGAFIVGTLIPALTTLFSFITAVAIPAIGAFIVANAAWIVPLLLVAATVYLVYLAFKNNFGGIRTTVEQLWFIIKYAFNNIVNQISAVIKKIFELASAFLKLKLPKALTPGSPTPFEMGLRGITSAMDDLSRKSLPKLQMGLDMPSMNGSGGGGSAGAGTNVSKAGATINIINPLPEKSSDAVRKTLKKLSYLGVEV